MSSSRRDALDRVRHFEQLANGQAHSESIVDGKEGSRICQTIHISFRSAFIAFIGYHFGMPLFVNLTIDTSDANTTSFIDDTGVQFEHIKQKKLCPFDPCDVDFVASISFNYGLSLMDMNQVTWMNLRND